MALPCPQRDSIEGLLTKAKAKEVIVGPIRLAAQVTTPHGDTPGETLYLWGVSKGTTMCGHDFWATRVAVYGFEPPDKSPFDGQEQEGANVEAAVLIRTPSTPEFGQAAIDGNEREAILLRPDGTHGVVVRTHLRSRYREIVTAPVGR